MGALADKIRGHGQATTGPNGGKAFTGRQIRRAMARAMPRTKGRAKTGTSAHFALWMAEGRVKTAFVQIPLPEFFNRLQQHGFKPIPQRMQDALNARYETLWEFSQTSRAELLAIKGIGEGTLTILEDQCTETRVPVKWGAPSGD